MQHHIELRIIEDTFKPALLSYSLPEEQMPFTALPEKVFERIETRNANGDFEALPICILWGQQPVGMFVLDSGEDLSKWTSNANAFFLRSLSINPIFQKKGIAKQAMQLIPAFLNAHFEDKQITEIVLGVNLKNDVAKNLYLSLGFKEYGFNMNTPFVGQIIMKWFL